MNTEQTALYKNLQKFSLDQPNAQFPFSKRLARDNRWSLDYAQRVVVEYKRFAFLAVMASHPVTPSDQVDQVWHLHLSYTRNYWEMFCPSILKMSLHHGPTQGGNAERQKFDQWYNKTLSSYEQFFEERPPSDIWPDSKVRFGTDLHFVKVNTRQTWLIPEQELSFRLPSLLNLRNVQPLRAQTVWICLGLSFLILGLSGRD